MRNHSAAHLSIPYKPIYRDRCGSVAATILFQQAEYRFSMRGGDTFYKFLEPAPTHQAYTEGDSWTEELSYSKREFRTAFDCIGVRHTSKTSFENADDPFQGKFYASYHDRIAGLTWYVRNHDAVDRYLDETSRIRSVSAGGEFTEVRKRDLRKCANVTYVSDETSFRSTTKELIQRSLTESAHARNLGDPEFPDPEPQQVTASPSDSLRSSDGYAKPQDPSTLTGKEKNPASGINGPPARVESLSKRECDRRKILNRPNAKTEPQEGFVQWVRSDLNRSKYYQGTATRGDAAEKIRQWNAAHRCQGDTVLEDKIDEYLDTKHAPSAPQQPLEAPVGIPVDVSALKPIRTPRMARRVA